MSGPVVTFFLGEKHDDAESLILADELISCHIQTPVEVHSPMDTGFKEDCGVETVFEEESIVTTDIDEKNVPLLQMEDTSELKGLGEANIEEVNNEPEKDVNSVTVSEDGDMGPVAHVSCLKEPDGQRETDKTQYVNKVLEVEQMDQKQENVVDLVGLKNEISEDSQSLMSSDESIAMVSDEECICDETEGSIQAANGYVKSVNHWSEVEASCGNILDLRMNGYPEEKENISDIKEENPQNITSVDINPIVAGEDLTENSDISILESSWLSGEAAEGQEKVSLMCLDGTEETTVV